MAVDQEPPVLELDLGPAAFADGPVREGAGDNGNRGGNGGGDRTSRAGARWRALRPTLAVALAGAVLGGGLVHLAERTATAGGPPVVRVALGEAGGRLLNRRLGSRNVLLLSTLAVNEGTVPVVVHGVRVEGDGAGLVRAFRGEASIYPFPLGPGRTGNMPITLTSDCDVRAADPPRVLLEVSVGGRDARESVDVRIPGLDELWRRATTADACAG